MTARKSLPIGIIVMILIMALAALGVGYAWWTEQLTASGTVQTGNIDVQMEDLVKSGYDPLNIATCAYSVSGDGKTMTVNIGNAYPAYVCSIDFNLTNHGTVTAKVSSVDITGIESGVTVIPSGELALKQGLTPLVKMPSHFRVEVNQDAAQNSTYSFKVTVNVAQGNAP